MEVKELDISEFKKSYTNVEYPAILITKPTNELVPVMMSCMYSGDVPLILEYNNDRKVVRKISPSAYNIQNLLHVCSGIVYLDDNGEPTHINTIQDYLEVFI